MESSSTLDIAAMTTTTTTTMLMPRHCDNGGPRRRQGRDGTKEPIAAGRRLYAACLADTSSVSSFSDWSDDIYSPSSSGSSIGPVDSLPGVPIRLLSPAAYPTRRNLSTTVRDYDRAPCNCSACNEERPIGRNQVLAIISPIIAVQQSPDLSPIRPPLKRARRQHKQHDARIPAVREPSQENIYEMPLPMDDDDDDEDDEAVEKMERCRRRKPRTRTNGSLLPPTPTSPNRQHHHPATGRPLLALPPPPQPPPPSPPPPLPPRKGSSLDEAQPLYQNFFASSPGPSTSVAPKPQHDDKSGKLQFYKQLMIATLSEARQSARSATSSAAMAAAERRGALLQRGLVKILKIEQTVELVPLQEDALFQQYALSLGEMLVSALQRERAQSHAKFKSKVSKLCTLLCEVREDDDDNDDARFVPPLHTASGSVPARLARLRSSLRRYFT